MNYFASGINDGLRIGADSYNKRKDRDQQSALEKARRELELDRDLKRQKFEQGMQGERITADAAKQFAEQNWRSGERKDTQGFQSGERVATQGFQSGERKGTQDFQRGESAADRAARKAAQDDTLNQAAKQFSQKLDFDYQNMGLGAGMKARELETRYNPDSTTAQLNAERLTKIKRENAEAADDPLRSTTSTASPKASAAPRKALTAQDADALAWAKANPYSPQAQKILERLGVK
jgi:hypothetical protein